MNNCPVCEAGDLELAYIDISGEWISLVITCDNCQASFAGDMQIDHMENLEEEWTG